MVMRVRRHCMIVDNHYPDIRVERESRALAERGYRVDIICVRAADEPPRERIGPIKVYRVPVRRNRGAGIARQLLEYTSFLGWATAMAAVLHQRHRYSTVQVHNVPDFLVFSGVVHKLDGVPIILDLHDLMPEFYASRFGSGDHRSMTRLMLLEERMSVAFADKVLTVTDLWRDALIARGVPPDKVQVVMNLPDPDIFRRREPTIRAGAGVTTLVYHGTFTHRYGIDILLRAFAVAARRRPLRLILHGRGEFLPQAEALIDQLDLRESVHLSTELLPTAQLPDLLSQAEIGVVPNRQDPFTDGILPTKLMEYAALGIPSIVSRSTAVERYFTDGMVRYVRPGDVDDLASAIDELAGDAERRLQVAVAAQRFTNEHPWESEAARYVALVDRLADSARVARGPG